MSKDSALVPGRALFWEAGKLRLLEQGTLRQLETPFRVRDQSSRLAQDGRVVALLGGDAPGEAYLWERTSSGTERLVRMPVEVATHQHVLWSPGAVRAQWSVFGGGEIWVAGLDGQSHRAAFGSEAVYGGAWRTDEELTVVTAAARAGPDVRGLPITDATYWSWRPPSAPVRFDGPVALMAHLRWSPDGRLLASLETTPTGPAVVLRGEATRTLVTERDLAAGPNDCARDVTFTGFRWSPDSRTLAVLGRGIGYFSAFVDVGGGSKGPPPIFASPVGPATCYIPGEVEWYGSAVIVPLYGPDCGPNASGRENALAVVDPKTAAVARYVLISRKGFLGLSGGWAAIASGPQYEATEFISLDTGTRVLVTARRLVDYCCAP